MRQEVRYGTLLGGGVLGRRERRGGAFLLRGECGAGGRGGDGFPYLLRGLNQVRRKVVLQTNNGRGEETRE